MPAAGQNEETEYCEDHFLVHNLFLSARFGVRFDALVAAGVPMVVIGREP